LATCGVVNFLQRWRYSSRSSDWVLVSTGFNWFQLVSTGFNWFQLVSTGFNWFQLVSTGFNWFQLVSTGKSVGSVLDSA
jgi:hypothetical protein